MAKNNLKNLLGTQKKIENKIDEKMIFFVFFEVPTAKNNFPTRIFFFFNFHFVFFTLFLATGHQLARYNAFLFAK